MARVTKAELDALADIIIYHRRDDGYYVEYAYGQPRLYLITDPATGRVREVSPRLPARELKLWLDGYTTCLIEGTQNPPVGVPTDVIALNPDDDEDNLDDDDDGAPNLDGMDADELWVFYRHHDRGQNSKELFPEGGPGTRNATKDLASYAANKATAMPLRAKGDIERAKMYEDIADRIYDEDLPEWAQW